MAESVYCSIPVFIFVVNFLPIYGHMYTQQYIDDNCDRTIKLNSSTLFSLSKEIFYRRGWKCITTIEVKTDHVISLRFLEFDVGKPSLMFCTDVVRIYDGPNKKSNELTPTGGLCGRSVSKPYHSTGPSVTIKFKSGYIGMSTGFKVLATAIKKNENGKCNRGMFLCKDGDCICESLVCDGMKNCIDGSDELLKRSGCNINETGTKLIWQTLFSVDKVIVIVGVIALTLILTSGFYLLIKYRRARRKRFD